MALDVYQLLAVAEQEFSNVLQTVTCKEAVKITVGSYVTLDAKNSSEEVIQITPKFVFLKNSAGAIRKITKTRLHKEFNIETEE